MRVFEQFEKDLEKTLKKRAYDIELFEMAKRILRNDYKDKVLKVMDKIGNFLITFTAGIMFYLILISLFGGK